MSGEWRERVIDVDTGPGDKPVQINCEDGSVVTVNVNVRHYGYPEWLDKAATAELLAAIAGRKSG